MRDILAILQLGLMPWDRARLPVRVEAHLGITQRAMQELASATGAPPPDVGD